MFFFFSLHVFPQTAHNLPISFRVFYLLILKKIQNFIKVSLGFIQYIFGICVNEFFVNQFVFIFLLKLLKIP